MDSLSKKISNLGIHDIRNAARFAQNIIVQYEPYQVDIRRATNTDSWGPTPKHLAKVMRHRYQVSMYLMTEYTLKRLVDHMAKRPKNLYEKARKQYVNYGNEWRVVLKCLLLLEFIMLNGEEGNELEQILTCLATHKHILTRDAIEFHIDFSNDGKMEIHERGIKKKVEYLIQLIESKDFLKRERIKHRKNSTKIVKGAMLGCGSSVSYNDNDIAITSLDLNGEYEPHTSHTQRRSSKVEQRKKRREILREQIKVKEESRKSQMNEPQIDLLDFTDDSINHLDSKKANIDNQAHSDDEFGEFQSDTFSKPETSGANVLDNLLDLNTTSVVQATHKNVSAPLNNPASKDAFADLFSYSKTQI